MKNFLNVFLISICLFSGAFGQAVPSQAENIPFLVTFGKEAPVDWGDDDHVHIVFFSIPAEHRTPVYIRVYDPDNGGMHDEVKTVFDGRTRFSVYGGKGAYTNKDAKLVDPGPTYDSGTLMASKTFGQESKYDNQWYSFGPFNPLEGEFVNQLGRDVFVFKMIVEGISGDDGNLYRLFLSTSDEENEFIDGGSGFCFEYSFRLPDGIAHIYPFIDESVTAVKLHNFDFDSDGAMRIVTEKRDSERLPTSTEGKWASSTHDIYDEERGACMDIQIMSNNNHRNNNMAFYMLNQYGEAMPFLTVPIGLKTREMKIIVSPSENATISEY